MRHAYQASPSSLSRHTISLADLARVTGGLGAPAAPAAPADTSAGSNAAPAAAPTGAPAAAPAAAPTAAPAGLNPSALFSSFQAYAQQSPEFAAAIQSIVQGNFGDAFQSFWTGMRNFGAMTHIG